MKIVKTQYEPSTMSVPAFFDMWLDDPKNTKITFKGKNATKAANKYKEGDEYDPTS